MSKPRVIAFYLPQFYPTPENDEWWEPGFTEWTNVVRAKPLFRGHYQPRIPRDLGFYDLRVPETREKQAQLASEAGIGGFCYWHYWFAGRRLLNRVFDDVVESGKPNYPFCLCWANHSWKVKTWDSRRPDKMLIEQTYPGIADHKTHFYAMLSAFRDKRYMKVNGKLIFGIFEPTNFKDFQLFAETWNQLAKKNGLDGFFFFGLAQGTGYYQRIDSSLYDAIVFDKSVDLFKDYNSTWIKKIYKGLMIKLLHKPLILDYNQYVNQSIETYKNNDSLIPCIDPDFDHTPRSSYNWMIFGNSTPDKWEHLCKSSLEIVASRERNNQLLFIKSWNEWGEGNYLEPDQRYGRAYIEATANAITMNNKRL
jgi:hypothetical protein